jgi:hypothetical protein
MTGNPSAHYESHFAIFLSSVPGDPAEFLVLDVLEPTELARPSIRNLSCRVSRSTGSVYINCNLLVSSLRSLIDTDLVALNLECPLEIT